MESEFQEERVNVKYLIEEKVSMSQENMARTKLDLVAVAVCTVKAAILYSILFFFLSFFFWQKLPFSVNLHRHLVSNLRGEVKARGMR